MRGSLGGKGLEFWEGRDLEELVNELLGIKPLEQWLVDAICSGRKDAKKTEESRMRKIERMPRPCHGALGTRYLDMISPLPRPPPPSLPEGFFHLPHLSAYKLSVINAATKDQLQNYISSGSPRRQPQPGCELTTTEKSCEVHCEHLPRKKELRERKVCEERIEAAKNEAGGIEELVWICDDGVVLVENVREGFGCLIWRR